MQIIKKQKRLGEVLFFVGICIHLLVMVIGFGEWQLPLRGRFMQVAFGLFCVKILTTYYSKQEWLVMVLTGVLGAASYFCTKEEYVLSVVVMIFAAKNTDMRRICKWIFSTSLIITAATAILSLCGIGGMAVDIRDYGRGGEEARWCLGFGHANNFHGTIWYLTALAVYLYFEKLNWKHYVLLTVGNLVLFYFTISKGGLIAVQLVLVAACLLRYVKPLMQASWIYVCGVLAVAGVMIISLASVTIEWTSSSVLTLLDRLFTGRINLAYQHAHISMWKLLNRAGTFQDTVDNGWVTIFFNYGYLIGILFVVFQVYLVCAVWKKKNGVLLVLLATCVFYTFMEATYTLNNVYFLSNVSYIVAMILMADKKEKTDEPKWLKNQDN